MITTNCVLPTPQVTNGNANAWEVPGLKNVIHFAVDAHEAGCAKPGAPIFHLGE